MDRFEAHFFSRIHFFTGNNQIVNYHPDANTIAFITDLRFFRKSVFKSAIFDHEVIDPAKFAIRISFADFDMDRFFLLVRKVSLETVIPV